MIYVLIYGNGGLWERTNAKTLVNKSNLVEILSSGKYRDRFPPTFRTCSAQQSQSVMSSRTHNERKLPEAPLYTCIHTCRFKNTSSRTIHVFCESKKRRCRRISRRCVPGAVAVEIPNLINYYRLRIRTLFKLSPSRQWGCRTIKKMQWRRAFGGWSSFRNFRIVLMSARLEYFSL